MRDLDVKQINIRVLELFGLINWSALQVKVTQGGREHLDAKLGQKLRELVWSGYTWLKHGRQCFTVQTPVCPALERISGRHHSLHSSNVQQVVILNIVFLKIYVWNLNLELN